MRSSLRVFAHRGASSKAPENTLASIAATSETGTDWFEFDVGQLEDGSLVVIHDDTVDRTTDGHGALSSMRIADVRGLDAGSWFSGDYEGERIPLLAEIVDISNQLKLNMNLEMKQLDASAQVREAFVEDILEALSGLELEREVLISSFDHGLLEIMRAKADEMPLGYLIEIEELVDPSKPWLEDAVRLDCVALHPPVEELTSEAVAEMRGAGLEVNVWTVNSVDKARQLLDWGVTGVFTDEARKMVDGLA